MPPHTQPTLWASLVQMNITLGRPEENLERALALLDQVGPERPHLALLPEVFTTNFTFREAGRLKEHAALALARLAERARADEIAIAGSIIESAGGTPEGFSNRAFFLDERGARLSNYAKRHLIRLGHEHLFYSPGGPTPPPPFAWQGVKVAMSICYDLRFPEWIGRSVLEGAEILLVPAQWPIERAAHWRSLLQARAIENQCFVVGCNRTGISEATRFGGGSEIFDPWGESLACAGSETDRVVTAALPMGRVGEVRAHLPAFAERAREERAR